MIALVILLYALWGFTFTLGKMALLYASPFFIIGTRMIIGGSILGTYAYHRLIHCLPSKDDVWLILQNMFFGIFFFYCARSWSLQYLTTTKAALLSNFQLFFTALFSYFLHRERLSVIQFLGLCIGFCGMLPILLGKAPEAETAGLWSFGLLSLPELVLLAAVASLSYSLVVMRTLVKHRSCNPVIVNALSMFGGGVLAMATSIGLQEKMIRTEPLMFVIVISLQILISNLICFNLQAFLMRHYSATFMALAGFIAPICTAFYGWILLNEAITWHYFASFILVLSGLALYYYHDFHVKANNEPA